MTRLRSLAVVSLLAVITATGCPDDDSETGASTGDATETTPTTTDATTMDASSSVTTEAYNPDGCDGCWGGFTVLIQDTDMESIVDQIEIAYTNDGVDSGKSAKDLCGETSCAIGEWTGELEVSVTYGTCMQTEKANGWLSCGCDASFAPWDPLTFTFEPACLDDA